MNRYINIFVLGLFLAMVNSSWAIMSGNPCEVMKADMEHNNGEIGLEGNFIFESDIKTDAADQDQSEKGEWYFVKGTANLNDSADFYVRLGVSHLEHENKSLQIEEQMDWDFAFGGGFMIELFGYDPWNFKLILDSQYYATFPGIDSVTVSSTKHTGGVQISYKEHNVQTSLLSKIKLGPVYPYLGATFAYRDINNKFTINNVEYDLSGKNENKVGITVGFDLPFNWEELVSGTGILSVEGRFIDEMGVNVALTNRF
jgi:hypothetical protein